MIKLYRTEAITKKSRRITVGTKLAGVTDIDPAQLPEVLSATMIRLSVGNGSDFKLLAYFSGIAFGKIVESFRIQGVQNFSNEKQNTIKNYSSFLFTNCFLY